MIQLLRVCIQTKHNAAQTLAIGELSEAEVEELLPTGKGFHVVVSSECIDTSLKVIARENVRELTEDEWSDEHAKNGKDGFIFPEFFEVLKKIRCHFSSSSSHFCPNAIQFP